MGTLGVSGASSTLFEGQESNNLSNGYQIDHFQSANNQYSQDQDLSIAFEKGKPSEAMGKPTVLSQ